MSNSNPPEGEKGPLPGDSIILPTAEQRRAEEERQQEQRRYETENAYKERQIKAVEAANDLARTNRNLTIGVILFSAITAGASWYQGRVNWHNWQTSNSTLQQMKEDAAESSRQFQAQLAHFDDGLGRTGLLATHAGEQAVAAKNAADAAKTIANLTSNQLALTQKEFETSQRPWISILSASTPGLLWNPYLGRFSLSIQPVVVYQNVGDLPATDIRVLEEVFFPEEGAVSTGRCNTGLQFTRWRLKAQGLSRALV